MTSIIVRTRMDISKLLLAEYWCQRSDTPTYVLTSPDNGELPKRLKAGVGKSPFPSDLTNVYNAQQSCVNPDLVIARVTPRLIKLLLTSNLINHDQTVLTDHVDVEHVSELLFDQYNQKGQHTLIVPVALFIQYINDADSQGALV